MHLLMGRKLELQIQEDEKLLKQLLSKEKHKMTYQKLQAIYFYKKDPSIRLTSLCALLNKSQSQVKRWFKSYREGGLEKLLYKAPRPGRPGSFNDAIIKALKEALNKEQFHSYHDVHQWLKSNYDIQIGYSAVHHQCRYQLGAKLKVARPSSIHKEESDAIGFKKNSPLS